MVSFHGLGTDLAYFIGSVLFLLDLMSSSSEITSYLITENWLLQIVLP
jgi:hypothetical protein